MRDVAAALVNRTRLWSDRGYSIFEVRGGHVRSRERLAYEERLGLRDMRPALQGNEVVVYDVGAAQGTYTAAAAKLENVAQVIAFEPVHASYVRLTKRAAAYPQVRCFELALGDENARRSILENEWADTTSFLPMSESATGEVPVAARLRRSTEVQVVLLWTISSRLKLCRCRRSSTRRSGVRGPRKQRGREKPFVHRATASSNSASSRSTKARRSSTTFMSRCARAESG